MKYTAVIQNQLFGNNFGKLEAIGTITYKETLDHVACSPAHVWCPPSKCDKMAAKRL